MNNQISSSRPHTRILNGYVADHPRSYRLNSALDAKRPQRGEGRKRTSEHARHEHSGRSPHSSEIDVKVPPVGGHGSDGARQTGGHRSRSSLRSDATDLSRPAGSAFRERFEIPDLELHGLVAVVDETEIQSGDFEIYVLVAVVLRDSAPAVQSMCDLVAAPGRKRPFHWRKEGTKNRDGARQLIRQHAVGTHVLVQATSRGGSEQVRAALMAELVTRLANDEIEHLIIESRGTVSDERDRAVILDLQHRLGSRASSYRWSSKSVPVLWFADALAGAAREAVANGDRGPIAGLQSGRIAPRVEWDVPTWRNA